MNFKEVNEFIQANPENDDVKSFVNSFYQPDRINSFLNSEAGIKIIQPRLDHHFSKSLETWKSKNLQGLIDDETAKLKIGETPEQKRIKALEERMETQRRDAQREASKNLAITQLAEKKLDPFYANFLIGKDEEETKSNVKSFSEKYEKDQSDRVKSKFKENGRPAKPGEKSTSTQSNYEMNKAIREGFGFSTNI